MKYLLIILFSLLSFNSAFSEENFDNFLFKNSKLIINSSSKTVGTFLEKINVYDQNTVSRFLNLWKNKKLFYIKETKKIVLISKFDNKSYYAIDIFSNAKIGKKKKKDFKKIKPNSGVRAKIATALVNFQIFSNDKNKRINSINALEKKILPEHLELLRKAFLLEEDDRLKIKNDLKIEVACYAISEEIWGEAEKLLKDIPEDKLTTKAYQALADIAGSQNNPEVVKNYLEKAANAKEGYNYFCYSCGNKNHNWELHCPKCDQLSTIDWMKIENNQNYDVLKISSDNYENNNQKIAERIQNEKIESKCGWSPFNGYKFKGTPVATIINGKIKMKDGKIIGDPEGVPLKFD